MDLICYPLMGTKSQRCMLRRRAKGWQVGGRAYHYVPRYELIRRLMEQTGLSEESVRKQIRDERLWLLQEDYGTGAITAADV
ncbi:hypothetical protein HUN01_06820 [Nostoc edaphicum CCNP1411]|uniref:Uncharacterized protein n=1 Tax=Nostoc edaphicum CCNP1411 TaxID=1472755 RepID=A0A7D7LBQ4_9NOSO|nr:hypothetical protein [Nostoc edaphicum]QMS87309.1 hypothetical protein HUN01_06820 [Nostoc edaphicum CCNP1411]